MGEPGILKPIGRLRTYTDPGSRPGFEFRGPGPRSAIDSNEGESNNIRGITSAQHKSDAANKASESGYLGGTVSNIPIDSGAPSSLSEDIFVPITPKSSSTLPSAPSGGSTKIAPNPLQQIAQQPYRVEIECIEDLIKLWKKYMKIAEPGICDRLCWFR
jgi:hypothetical protein